MSLDLTILGDDMRPLRCVRIHVDDHYRLVGFAAERRLPLIARMEDYYEDANIAAEELPAFIDEIAVLKTHLPATDPLHRLLDDMHSIAEEAMQTGRALDVIAD